MAIEKQPFETVWKDAFQAYEKSTKRRLQDQDILRKLQTTDDLLIQLQARQQAFGDWRRHHQKTWRFLSTCMRPVELLGNMASQAVSLSPFAPASLVLGAAFFLIDACNSVSNAYDSIDELFANLEGFANRLSEYTKGKIGEQLQKNVTAILTCLLHLIGRAEKLIKLGRIKEYFAVTFFGKDEKVRAALDRLNTLLDTEERLVISIIYSATQRIDERTAAMALTGERSEKMINELTLNTSAERAFKIKQEADELLRRMLASPSLDRTEEIYVQNKEGLLKKSGEWLQAEPLFEDWMSQKSRLLWVLGGPGVGKSFLSTQTISYLLKRYPQDPNHPSPTSVAYFFIKEDDPELHDLNTMLKSISLRIASSDNSYWKHATRICKSFQSVSSLQSTWKTLFMDFFASQPFADHSVILVIDGLDEAPKKSITEFVRLLEDSLLDKPQNLGRPPRMSLVIFGRPEIIDYTELSHHNRLINIGEKNYDDINNYIKENLKKVLVIREEARSKSKLHAEKLGRQIKNTILDKANGLFLWVKLVMEQIYGKERRSEVFSAIEEAPRELNSMIRHVFERLAVDEDVGKEGLSTILLWVTLAKRPLTMGEMDVILKIPDKDPYPLETRLKGRFASLFKLSQSDATELDDVDEDTEEDIQCATNISSADELLEQLDFESDQEYTDDEDINDNKIGNAKENENEVIEEGRVNGQTKALFLRTQIEFSHLSIKEFLLQEARAETRQWPDDLGFGFGEDAAQQNIALTCLRILCDDITQKYRVKFRVYAMLNLAQHLQSIKQNMPAKDKAEIVKYLIRLFTEENVIQTLLQTLPDRTSQLRSKNNFIHVWLTDPTFSQFIQSWFAEVNADDNPSFSPAQHSWLQKASSSSKEIFRTTASVAANIWLSNTNVDDFWFGTIRWWHTPCFMIWILYKYSRLDSTCSTTNMIQKVGADNQQKFDLYTPLSEISADEIQQLATLGTVEKTDRWYENVGRALYTSGYYNDAITNLHRALEFNKTAWFSMQLVGRCFGKLGKYDIAIKWMMNAMAAIREDASSAYSWQRIHLSGKVAKWTLKSGDIEAVIRFSHDQYMKQPMNVDMIDLYIDALTLGRRHEQIWTLLKDISGVMSSNGERSLLVDVLLNSRKVRNILHLALQSPQCNDELRAACNNFPTGIKDSHDGSKAALCKVVVELYQAAQLRYVYFDQIDEAILIWESMFKNKDTMFFWVSITLQLAKIFYDRAVSAKNTGTDYEPWIAKMRDLSKLEIRLKSSSNPYCHRVPLLLGHWLRDFEGVPENEWKPYFNASVLEALKLLSDDDPSNNIFGYGMLAQALELAGDSQNAAIAFGVAVQPLQALAIRRADTPNLGEDGRLKVKEDEILYRCDGPCGTKTMDYKELHMCRVCLDLAFCETCIKLVKNGQLPFNRCNPAHAFVQAFPIPDEIKDTVAQLAYSPAEFRIKWVEKLRKQWKK